MHIRSKPPKGSVWIEVESSISRADRRDSTERIPSRRTVSSTNQRPWQLWSRTPYQRNMQLEEEIAYDLRVSLLASASESESTESSEREPQDVYSSSLVSAPNSGVGVSPCGAGTACVLKHLLHWE